MQRGGRWRTVVKQGLLACAVGVLVVAAASFRWSIHHRSLNVGAGTNIGIVAGSLHLARQPLPQHIVFPLGLRVENVRPYSFDELIVRMTPTFARSPGSFQIRVPLWIPFLLTLGPYMLLARADRLAAKRARAHACLSCGYSRVGLSLHAACPECGKVGALDAAKA